MLDLQLKLKPHQQLHLQVINPLPFKTDWTLKRVDGCIFFCLVGLVRLIEETLPPYQIKRVHTLLVHRTRPPYHMCKEPTSDTKEGQE